MYGPCSSIIRTISPAYSGRAAPARGERRTGELDRLTPVGRRRTEDDALVEEGREHQARPNPVTICSIELLAVLERQERGLGGVELERQQVVEP